MPALKYADLIAFALFTLATVIYGYHYFYGEITGLHFYGYLALGLAYAGLRLYRLLTASPSILTNTNHPDQ